MGANCGQGCQGLNLRPFGAKAEALTIKLCRPGLGLFLNLAEHCAYYMTIDKGVLVFLIKKDVSQAAMIDVPFGTLHRIVV